MTVEQNAGGLAALAATLDEPVDRRALLRAELDAWTEPTDDVAPTREISQDLRAELDAWAEPTDDVAPTRENIRRLLGMLKRHLGDVLDPQKPMEDGSTLVTPHWASSLLETMIDGLVDLDLGKTPPLLKRSSDTKDEASEDATSKKKDKMGAAYTIQECKFNDTIVEIVRMVRQAKKDPSYRGPLRPGENEKAEAYVAKKLNAAGFTRRGGKKFTANSVLYLVGNNPRRGPLPD